MNADEWETAEKLVRSIAEKLEGLSADARDIRERAGSLVTGLAGINRRLDRANERLERIANRLEAGRP